VYETKPYNPTATGVIVGLALPLAVYLSAALTILGLDKFYYILAGGRKFATFPEAGSHLGISLAYLALVVLHLLWILGTEATPPLPNFWGVLQRSAIFLLLGFVAYPLGNDIYLYIHSGLMNLSHVDPFTTPAGSFTSELSPFVDWKQTSTYGPISQVFFTASAATLPIHPLLPIYGFKGLCLITHILNGYLVWRLLPEAERSKLAIAYLVCPVLLVEQVGGAHVDVFVNTCILLTATCLFRGRYAAAFLTLWGGFLTKTIPVIWMPMLVVFLIRQQRWKQLFLGLLASLLIAGTLWMTALPSLAAWRSLLNPGVSGQFQSSIHALIRAGLETLPYFVPDVPTSSQYKYFLLRLAKYTLIGFAAFYGWVVLRVFRKPHYSATTLLQDMGWITLVLMLYATSWLMPWYVSILYAIAVVIPQARLFGLTTLMFGVSSSAMYGLQNDSGLRSLVAVGLPTLTLIIGIILRLDKPLPQSSETIPPLSLKSPD
jgi:alpha-1,6-mannosyltransferase